MDIALKFLTTRPAGPADPDGTLDLGISRVTDEGIELSDGGWVGALLLDPVDIESLNPTQLEGLVARLATFWATLGNPLQLQISNRRYAIDHYLSEAIARWPQRWGAKLALRGKLLGDVGSEESWRAVISAHAAASNLRHLSALAVCGGPPAGAAGGAQVLTETLGQVSRALEQAGIGHRRLDGLELALRLELAFFGSGRELRSALQSVGSIVLAGKVSNLAFEQVDPLPEWVRFGLRSISLPAAVGERQIAAGYLRALPRAVDPGWLALAGKLACDFDLALHVVPVGEGEVMNRVKRAERQIAGTLIDAELANPDKIREQRWRAEDVDRLAEAMRGRDGYFKLAAFYSVSADGPEELARAREALAGQLAASSMVGAGAVGYQREAWLSTLPLGRERLPRRRGITSRPLAAGIPFAGRGRFDEDGWLLGSCGSGSGPAGPFLFNPFGPDYENPHLAILGQSGAGKTHLARAIAHSAWLWGAEVALLDPKDEYGALARRCRGSEIAIDLGGGSALNVFDGAAAAGPREYAGALADVARFWRAALGRLSGQQETLLESAIEAVCGSPANRAGSRIPLASDLAAEIAARRSADPADPASDLANRVRRFTGPALGGLFGSPTNVSLDNDFLLFQLAGLRVQDVDLYVLAVRLCLLSLTRWLGRPAERRLILVDEAWSLLHEPAGAKFLLDLAKTARARGAMLVLVTQDATDFAANPLARSILANCSATFIFRQHHAHAANLGELFNLDRQASARIATLPRGQAVAALASGERIPLKVLDHPW